MYDVAGRCIQLAENGSTPSYSGNAIKNFFWCGAERCEERDNSNTLVSLFCGLGQKTSGTNEFYSFDHLGSIREVTNGSGTVQSAFAFDPYGNISVLSGSVKPDFGFTGIYQHSRTNLALTWFRQYNPGFGRWLNRDPLGLVGGQNLYSYVDNSPIVGLDLYGLRPLTGPEKKFARSVFGSCIDPDNISILENFPSYVLPSLFPADRPYTYGNNIVWDDGFIDLSRPEIRARFAHELWHVWQYNQLQSRTPTRYATLGLRDVFQYNILRIDQYDVSPNDLANPTSLLGFGGVNSRNFERGPQAIENFMNGVNGYSMIRTILNRHCKRSSGCD